MKYILDEQKQSIHVKNYEHPTGTLATIFPKSAGEENVYVRFVYIPQTILHHTRGQVSVSMNIDPINAKNKSTTNNGLIKTKTQN